jgi:hypothetical protein
MDAEWPNPLSDALRADFRTEWVDAVSLLCHAAEEYAAAADACGRLRAQVDLDFHAEGVRGIENEWRDLVGTPPNLGAGALNHLYRWAIEYVHRKERGVLDPRPLLQAALTYAAEIAALRARANND